MTATSHTKLVCLDFDGVIHSYVSGWQGASVADDPPTPGAIQFIRAVLADPELSITICSSRFLHPSGKDTVRRYLSDHGMTPEEIEQVYMDDRKPPAFITLDDRAHTFTGTFPSLHTLKDFKPWYKKAQSIEAQLKDAQTAYLTEQDEHVIAKIVKCSRCGEDHVDVTVIKLKGQPSHASHYFMCPDTQQPVLVSIELKPTHTKDT